MKQSLRKSTSGISVTYSNGNYTNNLVGAEFELDESESRICLNINLDGNLRVRNKAVNCYDDACELAECHTILKAVQIDEEQIIKGLIKAHQRNPSAHLELQLRLGEKGTFLYSVEQKRTDIGVILNVIGV